MNQLDKKVYDTMARYAANINYEPDYESYYETILLSDVLNYIHVEADPLATDISERLVLNLWDLQLHIYEEQSEECKTFIRNLVG